MELRDTSAGPHIIDLAALPPSAVGCRRRAIEGGCAVQLHATFGAVWLSQISALCVKSRKTLRLPQEKVPEYASSWGMALEAQPARTV